MHTGSLHLIAPAQCEITHQFGPVTTAPPLTTLPLPPPLGECVLQRAVMVRKKLTAREGRGWVSGTLFCTHFRVAFVPQDSPKPDVSPSEPRR